MIVNEKVAGEHGLKPDEWKRLCDRLGREPTWT